MSDLTIKDIMRRSPSVFLPEKAQGVSAVVQFHFTGKETSAWIMHLADGACTVEEGTDPNPRMTMTVDSQDYIDIITGKLNGMQAFMQGKVRVTGDMSLAMKFPSFFSMGG